MNREEKKLQFRTWAYGLFIHYGVYSVHGLGEWLMAKERMGEPEYFSALKDFHPEPGMARRWVELARDCGMKYVVLTTRHHDGHFIGHELVAEYCRACRELGLGVGLYYSVMNWCDPNYRKGPGTPEWKVFVERTHRQIRDPLRPAVQHRDRVAKAECFCRYASALLNALFSCSAIFIPLAHQKISTILLVLADSPCSGSLNSACMVAHARSAWLASSLRLAS